MCITAKRKERRKAKEKTRQETRNEGKHLGREPQEPGIRLRIETYLRHNVGLSNYCRIGLKPDESGEL